MGGRGASSGISVNNNKYGTQYHTVLQSGDIKFVVKNSRHAESLLETMTPGRIYVTVGGTKLMQIIYFDKENKRRKTVDLRHEHNGLKPHTHHGYYHNERDGDAGGTALTSEETKMVDKVKKIWYNYLGGR